MRPSILVAALTLVATGACASDSPDVKQDGAVTFTSCAKAKDAGYSSMRRGEPGYSAKLDGEVGGVACDK